MRKLSRIILKKLPEVRGLLRLIQVEFMKIKRQKFIILTLLASLLVPFP
ncbi:MAG: ABC transporter permease, partial [Eubacterium callanderi]